MNPVNTILNHANVNLNYNHDKPNDTHVRISDDCGRLETVGTETILNSSLADRLRVSDEGFLVSRDKQPSEALGKVLNELFQSQVSELNGSKNTEISEKTIKIIQDLVGPSHTLPSSKPINFRK